MIEDKYLNWLYAKVFNARSVPSYRQLFEFLFKIEFIPMDNVPLDQNRFSDVERLRSTFGYETGADVTYLNGHVYSLLEVMIYLCMTIDHDILPDIEEYDGAGHWFRAMLASSGLNTQYDGAFSPQGAGMICDRIMFRRYNFDGRGGLFTVQNPQFDMTLADLYRQMMWYLSEVYPFD